MLHGIHSIYLREFDEVRSTLLGMGTLVDNATDRSMEALLLRDTKLANAVVKKDSEIKKYRFQIEEKCLELMDT